MQNCSVFKDLPVKGRYEVVLKHRLCMACFNDQHWSSKCKKSCLKCKRRHYVLLHQDQIPGQDKAVLQSSAALLDVRSIPATLLGTALVLVRDVGGQFQSIWALFDSGSQISAITAKISDRLGLRQSRWTVLLTGLSGHYVPGVTGTVQLTVYSGHDAGWHVSVKA